MEVLDIYLKVEDKELKWLERALRIGVLRSLLKYFVPTNIVLARPITSINIEAV
jgi:hypothetical protein